MYSLKIEFLKGTVRMHTHLPEAKLGGMGEFSLAIFWKSKKCLDFGEKRIKGSDCVRLWVKFCIQSVVLRVSRR